MIETLKDVKTIGGFEVCEIPTGDMPHPEYIKLTEGKFILHNLDKNRITFQIQNGPIKEAGVNGCQVDTLIEAAFTILKGLNLKVPCQHNVDALDYLDRALVCLETRRHDRLARGVEGESKP